jgi:cytochrome c biogenesis protein CcmG/thiol:disulfide interchange protein DsbE
MKRWITFAVALAVVLGAVQVVTSIRRAGQAPPPGEPAPDFKLQDLAGREVALSSLRGKVVAVNFWATWCPPCKQEIPEFAGLYTNTAGKCLELLGVAADSGTPEEIGVASKELGINYPVLVDDKGEAAEKFKVLGYPMTFLVDVNGRLRKTFDGMVSRTELEGPSRRSSRRRPRPARSGCERAAPLLEEGVPSTCPMCGKPAAPLSANRAFPFCSDRCKLLDLGKWLGEEYRVPGPRAGDGGEGGERPARRDEEES